MVQTRNCFPYAKIDEGTVEEYAKEWIDMAQRFGLDRFEKGLNIAKKWKLEAGVTVPRTFFPLPGEIEEIIRTQTFNPTYAQVDPNCTDCSGTGFRYAGEQDGNRMVRPCGCRRVISR